MAIRLARAGAAAALVAVLALPAACKPFPAAVPPQPGPSAAARVVRLAPGATRWFWRLDRRLVDCPPGLAVKFAYNTIYLVPLGRIPAARRIGHNRIHRDWALCKELLRSGYHGW